MAARFAALKLIFGGVLVVWLLSLVRCGQDAARVEADVRKGYFRRSFRKPGFCLRR